MADDQLSGRELDAAVAERVMKWKRVGGSPTGNIFFADENDDRYTVGNSNLVRCWSPSREIEAAMQVVEKLGEGPWTVMMSSGDERTDREWFVEFVGTSDDGRFLLTGEPDADSLPEAICRAALAAIGDQKN